MTALLNFATQNNLMFLQGPCFNGQVGGGTKPIKSNDGNHWKKCMVIYTQIKGKDWFICIILLLLPNRLFEGNSKASIQVVAFKQYLLLHLFPTYYTVTVSTVSPFSHLLRGNMCPRCSVGELSSMSGSPSSTGSRTGVAGSGGNALLYISNIHGLSGQTVRCH